MIAQLTGTVTSTTLRSLVLDVAGVGYLVNVTPRALSALRVGEQGTVHTSLVVREDALTLFGFEEARDRDVFEVLVSVQGIGPRLALAILSVHPADQIALAASTEDTKAFTQVPGIGPKSAQRIVLELKGKLMPSAPLPTAVESTPSEATAERVAQVVEALSGLGWSDKDANKAVTAALKDDPMLELAGVPELLRRVLSGIGRGMTPKAR